MNPDFIEAYRAVLGNEHLYSVGDIFGLNKGFDAIVSPANSFGWMDGGIDLAYVNYFGGSLEHDLQRKIDAEFDGELLVGQAAVVETGYHRIPLMISAPTMRVPHSIVGTMNVYLAFRAVLLAARKNSIESILSPCLGTLTGGMPALESAQQINVALRNHGGNNARDN
jgi:O-acetyl-ADP-ribose deacetylase (regulator of RNase III)